MSTDTAINKPLIQIDDEIREMTDEEYSNFLQTQEPASPLLGRADE